ncbi:MAG: 4-hydroxy-3-methylbut-2-enyl diphosphate reductase, partial [Lachnospiraceae bacterium]|nr:4-hydroxy-3-methylbut-2-enyl diphosphate reductase [Lachnospiraceae bacterium]
MEIRVAKSAGFCFGVNRAIQHAYDNIGRGSIYSYGPIIHNKEVTADLESKGVKIIDSFEGIEEGTVIIRSHGVGKQVYDELERRGLSILDGTCPFVKKIHNIVKDAHNDGRGIIIIGDPDHPEVMGINGWCDRSAFIIDGEYKGGLKKDVPYTVVVQTTYRKEKFEAVLKELEEDGIKADINNTICSATSERQAEAEKIAKEATKMLVVGDKSSSNTQKLYEICKKNCNNTFYIETIKDLVLNIFNRNVRIGITAGAST